MGEKNDLAIILDRKSSIKIVKTTVFGHEALRCVCYYHRKKNMAITFHNMVLNEYLRRATYTYKEETTVEMIPL